MAGCLPAYKSQAVPAVKNSSQFFNVFITLPDCFYGLVSSEQNASKIQISSYRRSLHVISNVELLRGSESNVFALQFVKLRQSRSEDLPFLAALQININFIGQVTNIAGTKSLPIKPVGYNRVATRTPIITYSAFETLPALSKADAACL